jgi:hypothetical protein
LVCWQGFFGDHVADEHHEQVIGELPCMRAKITHLFTPIIFRKIREEIRRLPALSDRLEQGLQVLLNKRLHALDHFELLRCDGKVLVFITHEAASLLAILY